MRLQFSTAITVSGVLERAKVNGSYGCLHHSMMVSCTVEWIGASFGAFFPHTPNE